MKKFFTAAVTLLFMTALLAVSVSARDFTISPAATGEILGDANGDGRVSSSDVALMKKLFAGIEDSAEIGADANGDGKVASADVLNLKRNFAGMEEIGAGNDNDIKIVAVDGVDIRNMVIVAPEGTDKESDNAAYAADQLRKYLKIATGYEYVVEYGAPSEAEHALYVQYDPTIQGEGDLLDKTVGELGEEGFIIEVRDGNVYITGGRLRGCMYGVYEFLEEYIGYRFIELDEDFIYTTDIINLKSGIYDEQRPSFDYRHAGGRTMGSDFSRKRKINTAGGFYESDKKYGYQCANHYINAHSFVYYRDDMWPIRQGEDDYDAELGRLNTGWQPCFTGEESFQEMFRGMLRVANMVFNEWGQTIVPGQSRFSFSLNDNVHYCDCADCRELYARIGVTGASVQFANRAADEFVKHYPGVKTYMIFYDKTPPAAGVTVSENLSIMYCGTGCNNHIPGTGDCGDNLTVLGTSNKLDEISFPQWSSITDTIYFWAYEVTYMCYLAPCPNVLNVLPDLKFIYDNGSDGYYYEGSNSTPSHAFEGLKAYIASCAMWDAEMTEDECKDLILEYLWIRYGEGYNEIYRLIELMDEAGNNAGCFINNHDYPWEMYDKATLAKNSAETLELIGTAYEKATNDRQRDLVEKLSLHIQFLDLCATYEDVYVNGTDADAKADYAARYEWLWNYHKNNDIPIFSTSHWLLPATCNLDQNPMDQFYGGGYSG